MIVDTSAIFAIILQEPEWEAVYQQAIDAPVLYMSSGTMQEVLIVAQRKNIWDEVNEFLMALDLAYVAVDEVLARCGAAIYQQYGKGQGHPAQLNYGDCFAAALAQQRQLPILYAGEAFQKAGF